MNPKPRIVGNANWSDCCSSRDCPAAKPWGTWRKPKCRPKCVDCCPACWTAALWNGRRTCSRLACLAGAKATFLAALGQELILRHNYAVLFTPTFKLVQQLLTAKKELRLESALQKLDNYNVVILDDIGYIQQDREEMDVLFTFLAERYERRSVMLSSNLVFSKWDQIFKDPMTTMAAIDRLVHHAIILEFVGETLRGPQGATKGGG